MSCEKCSVFFLSLVFLCLHHYHHRLLKYRVQRACEDLASFETEFARSSRGHDGRGLNNIMYLAFIYMLSLFCFVFVFCLFF